MMKRQAERMADTFGMETVEQLLSKVERESGADNCIVCGQVSVTMSPSSSLSCHVSGGQESMLPLQETEILQQRMSAIPLAISQACLQQTMNIGIRIFYDGNKVHISSTQNHTNIRDMQ